MSWTLFVILILVLWIVCWCIAIFVLDAPNHNEYDACVGDFFDSHPDDEVANRKLFSTIGKVREEAIKTKSLKGGLKRIREFADNLSSDLETDTAFSQVSIGDINAEWAVAPNVDVNRRILFFHGGAFIFGSAVGHRKISDRLSRLANAAVLSVDYRLLPENPRKASVLDAQYAYQWVIENNLSERKPCDFLMLVGDSAGGNIALMLSSWSKQNNSRRPDGVIGLSPSLDSTFSAPSYKLNRKTDEILGPSLGKLLMIPKAIQLWIGLLTLRANPSNPELSPLFYDLVNLPPTLIHASSSEILLGDAQRYTNKAINAGSNVTLQIWKDQIHDWHLFNMGIGSAVSAWNEVEKFVQRL